MDVPHAGGVGKLDWALVNGAESYRSSRSAAAHLQL